VDLSSNPFKVTGSVDHPQPDANQSVAGDPTFSWDAYASSDFYEVTVLDSFGNIIWDTNFTPVHNNGTLSIAFNSDHKATQSLQSGQYYQFHVMAVKNPSGTCSNPHPISSTEDLRGVFLEQ